MLKIEIAHESAVELLLKLAGRIAAEHAGELGRLIASAEDTGRRVRLDLGDVTLADRAAVAFLAVGAGRAAALERCPAFLREWIRREGAGPARLGAAPETEDPRDDAIAAIARIRPRTSKGAGDSR